MDDLETAATTFQALGHPKRLAIVRWLLERHVAECTGDPEKCKMEPTTCDFTDLVDRLDVTKATISHHVKTLVEAGLIECEREGRVLRCTVNRERLQSAQTVFSLSAPDAGIPR
ncbi:MAG: ArsR/SmtB family transcription factor [Salinibacter sp.]